MFSGHTRIAPTPSGYLHLGNIYAFCYTAEKAAAQKLSLRLRIDDLDRSRFREAYLNDIFALLRLLGIDWQAGPQNAVDFHTHHRQILRLPLYNAYLDDLRATGLVYACGCSRTARNDRSPGQPDPCRERKYSLHDPQYAWRLHVPAGSRVRLHDWEGTPAHHVLDGRLEDFVVRRKAENRGEVPLPAYQLACVADDVLHETTHIVRGEDLFESSLAQLYIAQLLQKDVFSAARFVHHPVLKAADGSKLSKSAGDQRGRSLSERYPSRAALLQALAAVKP
jgi:glutamyl-tRNA synthetase